MAKLPLELQLDIIDIAIDSDLRTAHVFQQVSRKYNILANRPSSAVHNALKIGNLKELLQTVARLRTGEIDAGRVEGIFMVNVIGEGFEDDQEREESCRILEGIFEEIEKEPMRSSRWPPYAISEVALNALFDRCECLSALHLWCSSLPHLGLAWTLLE